MNKIIRVGIALMAIVAGAYLTLVVASIILKLIFAVCAIALTSLILMKSDKPSQGDLK